MKSREFMFFYTTCVYGVNRENDREKTFKIELISIKIEFISIKQKIFFFKRIKPVN